jgi:hypothetical protein
MTSRLVQQCRAKMVEVLTKMVPLLPHARTNKLRDAAQYDSRWVTSGMGIDDAER